MYNIDKLLHSELPPLYTPEFSQLRKDIVIPDILNFDKGAFKAKMVEHFRNNQSNNLKGFDAFGQHDVILGCQHYIDNLISKNGLNGLQIFEHDYHYYKKLDPHIKYVTVDTLENDKPLLMAMPFPGHLGVHRQMDQILQICTEKNINVHLDCAWLSSAFDIDFDFDRPCIKSFAMSLSKAFDLHWNKIGIRWSRNKNDSDGITIQNNTGAISRLNMYMGQKYIEKFPIDYLCRKYKDKYFQICRSLKLRPSNIIHACFSIDRNFLFGLKKFFD